VDLATMAVFSGNAHPQLAQSIAHYLRLPLAKAHVGRFSDGEFNVEILENIRGRETFIIQPTCPPTSENLMELLVMVDAARRASAARITAVVPYFGFARQDRRPRSSRVPITSKLVAKMFGTAGVDRLLTVDLHAEQIQGFFDIAVDNVYASPLLLSEVWKHKYENMVVVSPDVGGVVRARALAKRLGDADLVIIDKRRDKTNQSEVMNLIGDVDGKNCVMIDDMVDTAGTLCHAADALKEHGAVSVAAYITHAVLSGPAVSRITNSSLDEVVVTDTIPLNAEAQACTKIRELSIAELLAETMRRISYDESVSSLYVD
jgi:ribose-phosphate pyrophosphokinase